MKQINQISFLFLFCSCLSAIQEIKYSSYVNYPNRSLLLMSKIIYIRSDYEQCRLPMKLAKRDDRQNCLIYFGSAFILAAVL